MHTKHPTNMIFYFSATGNSRWVAIQLAAKTRERLINITDALQGDCTYPLSEDESIGFIFPVHGWRTPKIIDQFIARLTIDISDRNSKKGIKPYCFVLLTAGDEIGQTLNYLHKDIKHNSSLHALYIQEVDAAFNIIMPESYIGLPGMNIDTTENQQKKYNNAKLQLQSIAEAIIKRQKGLFSLVKGPAPWLYSKVLGGIFKHILVTDKYFKVDINKCIRCGICTNVCPVHNIEGGHGKTPTWKHNQQCLTCFACFHHCPKHAIDWGKMTQNKGQYFFK